VERRRPAARGARTRAFLKYSGRRVRALYENLARMKSAFGEQWTVARIYLLRGGRSRGPPEGIAPCS
jgi:hypothetical protein